MKKKLKTTFLAACTAATLLFAGVAVAVHEEDNDNDTGIQFGLVDVKEGIATGRVVAVNGQPVSITPAPSQGGVAGDPPDPGDCDGLCGSNFPAGCIFGDDEDPCECSCEQMCFIFDDCCEDVCNDCPDHLGCDEENNLGVMYQNPGANSPHPGFIWCCVAALHGSTILADHQFKWTDGELVGMLLTVANLAGGGVNTDLVHVSFDLVFADVELAGDQAIQSSPNPPFGTGTGLFFLEPVSGVLQVPQFDAKLTVTVEVENINLEPGFLTLVRVPLDPAVVEIPRNSWIGMKYNSAGTVFSDGGALSNLGQQVRYPPTFGGSLDRIYNDGVISPFMQIGITPHMQAALAGIINPGMPISAFRYTLIGTVDIAGACQIGGDVPQPPCPADIAGGTATGGQPDGVVDGFDLLALLGAWTGNNFCADCNDCPADIAGGTETQGQPDCKVNGFDLLALLGDWGPCPTNPTAGDDPVCELRTQEQCDEDDGEFTREFVSCGWPGVFTEDAAGACCFASGGCLSPVGFFSQSQTECESRVLCCHGQGFADCDPVGIVTSTDPLTVDWMTAEECTKSGGTPHHGMFAGPYIQCVEANCGCGGTYTVDEVEGTGCDFGINENQTCFCDAACFENNDCCIDICPACGDADLPAWEPCLGCELFCGSPFATLGGCFCDAGCTAAGDCCPDFCDECFEDFPQNCPQPEQATCSRWCGFDADGIEDFTGVPHFCSCHSGCNPTNGAFPTDPNDCCLDQCELCPAQAQFCPDPNSCVDNPESCGTIAPGGACWCDPLCCSFGDCCVDKWHGCGGDDCIPMQATCGPDPDTENNPWDGAGCATAPDDVVCTTGIGPFFCCCDDSCCIFQDCCEDKLATCGGCDPAEGGAVACPTGFLNEPEDCQDCFDASGACVNNTCANATNINCGDQYCGTMWLKESGQRDFDWWKLDISAAVEPQLVEICIQAGFHKSVRVRGGVGSPNCPDPTTVQVWPPVAPGVKQCISYDLEPAVYWIQMGPLSTSLLPDFGCVVDDETDPQHGQPHPNRGYTLEVTCLGESESCIGNCGASKGQNGMECSCDEQCFLFGDCCLNACSACGAPEGEQWPGLQGCRSCQLYFPANNPEFECGPNWDPLTDPLLSSPDGSCQCDENCCIRDDCCFDKVSGCGGCDPADFATCEGACGTYGPSHCYCDAFCHFFGDCCDDICDFCSTPGCP